MPEETHLSNPRPQPQTSIRPCNTQGGILDRPPIVLCWGFVEKVVRIVPLTPELASDEEVLWNVLFLNDGKVIALNRSKIGVAAYHGVEERSEFLPWHDCFYQSDAGVVECHAPDEG